MAVKTPQRRAAWRSAAHPVWVAMAIGAVLVLTGDHWQVQRSDVWRWLPAWLLRALPVHPQPSFSASQPHARVTVLDMARLEKND